MPLQFFWQKYDAPTIKILYNEQPILLFLYIKNSQQQHIIAKNMLKLTQNIIWHTVGTQVNLCAQLLKILERGTAHNRKVKHQDIICV